MADNIESAQIELGINAKPVLDLLQQIAEKFNELEVVAKKSGISLDDAFQKYSESETASAGLETLKTRQSDVTKELNRTQKAVVQLEKQGSGSLAKLKDSLDAVGQGAKTLGNVFKQLLLPFLSGATVIQSVRNYVKSGEELYKLSRATRMSADELDAWRMANVAAGGSAEAFSNAIKSFSERTGASGKTFIRMCTQLNGMSDQQARYALKWLGISRESAEIFLQNNQRMKDLVGAYRQFAMTPKDAENARRLRIMWSTTSMTIEGLGRIIARSVLPYIQSFMEKFQALAMWIGKHSTSIEFFIKGIGAAMLAVFGPRGAVMLVGKAIAFFTSPIGIAVAALTLLLAALDDLRVFANGGNSLFGQMLEELGYSQEEIQAFREQIIAVKNSFGELWEATKPLREALLAIFGMVVVGAIRAIVAVVGTLVLALTGLIKKAGEFKDGFISIWDNIKGAIGTIIDWLTAKIQALIDFFSGLKPPEWISNVADKVGNFFSKNKPTISLSSLGQSADGEVVSPSTIPPQVADSAGKTTNTTNNQNTVNNKFETTVNVTGDANATDVERAAQRGVRQAAEFATDYTSMAETGVIPSA